MYVSSVPDPLLILVLIICDNMIWCACFNMCQPVLLCKRVSQGSVSKTARECGCIWPSEMVKMGCEPDTQPVIVNTCHSFIWIIKCLSLLTCNQYTLQYYTIQVLYEFCNTRQLATKENNWKPHGRMAFVCACVYFKTWIMVHKDFAWKVYFIPWWKVL